MLRILNTGIAAAQDNMDLDAKLLETLDRSESPILHFYDWIAPSVTYGYFANPDQHLDLGKAAQRGVALGRRPTGGGIVFHIWDLAFSFLMPSTHPAFSLNTLENYHFVNHAVLDVVSHLFHVPESVLIPENLNSPSSECQNFCMAKPTRYDVVCNGRKIAGAAQRRTKLGYLHQGTISLASPHLDLLGDLLRSKAVLNAMVNFTFMPLGFCWNPSRLKEARDEIRQRLGQKFMEKL